MSILYPLCSCLCAMEKGNAMGKSGMLEFFMGATLYSQSETEQNKFDWEHDAIRLMDWHPWTDAPRQMTSLDIVRRPASAHLSCTSHHASALTSPCNSCNSCKLTMIFTSVMLNMFTFHMGTNFLYRVAVVQLLIWMTLLSYTRPRLSAIHVYLRPCVLPTRSPNLKREVRDQQKARDPAKRVKSANFKSRQDQLRVEHKVHVGHEVHVEHKACFEQGSSPPLVGWDCGESYNNPSSVRYLC